MLDSEHKYRKLVETSQDIIWAIDLDNRFTFVNDAVRTTSRLRARRRSSGAPSPTSKTRSMGERDPAGGGGHPGGGEYQQYETEHLRKDGTPVTLSFQRRDASRPDGEVIGSTGTARDVTEQKRVEDAVAPKHRQMQAIIDNSPLRDLREGRLCTATCWPNRGARRCGAAACPVGEGAVGRTTSTCCPRRRPSAAARATTAGARLAPGPTRRREVPAPDIDGGDRTLPGASLPLLEADGTATRCAAWART